MFYLNSIGPVNYLPAISRPLECCKGSQPPGDRQTKAVQEGDHGFKSYGTHAERLVSYSTFTFHKQIDRLSMRLYSRPRQSPGKALQALLSLLILDLFIVPNMKH